MEATTGDPEPMLTPLRGGLLAVLFRLRSPPFRQVKSSLTAKALFGLSQAGLQRASAD